MPDPRLSAGIPISALLACVLFLCACSDRPSAEPPQVLTAADTVQQLFSGDPPEPFFQEESFRNRKEELFDWIERTGPVDKVHPGPAQPMTGLGRTIVDATLEHPGGGRSTISAQLEQDPSGRWKIVWLRGPAGSWPPR